jgi:hypothetical protein
VHLIESASLVRHYPEPLAYVVRLERDERIRFHVLAGVQGALRDHASEGLEEKAARQLYDRLVLRRLREGFCPAAESEFAPPVDLPEPSEKLRAYRQALLKRLHPDVWRTLTPVQRSRLVWRVGAQRALAAGALLPLLGSGDAMLDYCLCWALGRGGDRQALPALRQWRQQGGNEMVRRMATLAWLELSDDFDREKHANTLIGDWPALLREAWASGALDQVEAALAQPDAWQRISQEEWLEQLDQVAQAPTQKKLARALLKRHIAEAPLKYGAYRLIRRLYKAAEFRGDAEIYGLLHERFEATPPTRHASPDYVYIGNQSLRFREAVKSHPEALDFAYTSLGRAYLLRRAWRNLRRLGRVENPEFIALALGVLVAFQDEHADPEYAESEHAEPEHTESPRTDARSRWDFRQGRQTENQIYYDPYSRWIVYHALLHAHNARQTASARTGSRRWDSPDLWPETADTLESPREEAFPALWDQQPEALLWLLQHARCSGVARFAARALLANPAFCANVSSESLSVLLQSPIPDVAQFAFDCLRKRLETVRDAAQEGVWLLALISTPLEAAHRFVLDRVSAEPARYATDAKLIAAMLCAPNDGIRKIARLLCESAKNRWDTPKNVLEQALDWLEDCEAWSGPLAEIADNVRWSLQHSFPSAAADAPYERLLALLRHACPPIVRLGVDWLALHRNATQGLPPETLRALLESNDPELCAAGVRLFSALPDHVQIAQPALFIAFCLSAHADVRRAIMAALEQLTRKRPVGIGAFAQQICDALRDTLFRRESAEGLHDDILRCLEGALRAYACKTDIDTHRRLCVAQSKGAQCFGAWLLGERRPLDFKVADWAMFARAATQAIRQWAYNSYRAHPTRVEDDMEAGLRIFDSRWEDAQAFAQDFFRTHGRWTPALLVSLCDHSKAEVQGYGRELMTRHADMRDVVDYLLKLSQHPSAAIQWMVSDWLEAGVGEDIQRLRQLRPYFLSVLSQVNRARKAKTRVLDFLRRQAEKSEAAAATVAELFARQVASVAIADKAAYLEGLREIHARFPQLPSPLVVEPLRQHSVSRP